MVKVEELVKGKTASLDQLKCSVALFKFSNDEAEMTEAQYAVTSGQADVLVRDQTVMAKLPALYRAQTAPASRPAAPTQAARIATLQAQLQRSQRWRRPGAEAKKLRAQIQAMSQRARSQESDADIKAKPPQGRDRKDFDSKPIKRATKPAKPAVAKAAGTDPLAAIRKSGGVVPYYWQGKILDPRDDAFAEALAPRRFRTIENAASEEVSVGWVTPADPTGDSFAVEDLDGGVGTWLRFRIDKKSMPMKWLQIHRDAAEKARGKRLSAKERKELKEDLMDQLLPRVLPTITLVDALLFHERKTVLLFATSKTAKEAFAALLRDVLDPS